jgi:group I intron endonuclease
MNKNYNTGIYKIENKINGKVYIGSSVNLKKRKREHFFDLKNNDHHSSKLQKSYNKHGHENFLFIPLLFCSKDNLIFYEQLVIDKYDCVNNGYNILPSAGSMLGYVLSPEAREKISKSKKGTKKPPLTDEQRKNMSLAQTGVTRKGGWHHTEETKEKIRAAHKGNKYNLGKKLPKEHKEKIGIASKRAHQNMSDEKKAERAKKFSETYAKKRSDPNNAGMSIEGRKNISIAALARHQKRRDEGIVFTHSEESIEKMRQSALLRNKNILKSKIEVSDVDS